MLDVDLFRSFTIIPVDRLLLELEKILSLLISDGEKEWILSNNTKRLIVFLFGGWGLGEDLMGSN